MSTNLGGLTSAGGSAVNHHWWVAPQSPADLFVNVTTTLVLKYVADATDGSTYTGELQLATDAAFTTPTTRTNAALTDGVVVTETFTVAEETQYFWRVRSQDIYGAWSAWSEAQSAWILPAGATGTMGLTVNVLPEPQTGFAAEFLHVNIGPRTEDWGDVIHLNTGVRTEDGTEVFFLNVGNEGFDHDDAGVLSEDVTTNTPVPHIWWLKPMSGREGDGVEFVGYGFGVNAAEFNGTPLWTWDESTEVALPVATWVSYPASADAYTADRQIDQLTDTIDPAHQQVGVVVPLGSIPPGYKVRFRTDGP